MAAPKVAVVTPGSFVIPSGRSSSVERVVEKVCPLAAKTLDIRIYGVADGRLPVKGMVSGIPCYRLPGGRRYFQYIVRHLRLWRPDTIEVHNRPLLAYQIKSRLPKTRVYLSLHSTTFLVSRISPNKMFRMLESPDGLIVNSVYLKEEIRRRFPFLKTGIEVNPLGVSLDDFNPRWTPAGESLRLARLADLGWSGRKIVLFVGRLLPSKGVHHLLNVWGEVLSREPEAMLLIVGSAFYGSDRDTRYSQTLKKRAESFGDRIVFLPFVPYPKVANWYNLADVAVVPSAEGEAFGLVNVEAMASAVPVIATAAGGIPEIVADGRTGFLLPAGDPEQQLTIRLLYLLQHEEVRRKMGQNGRQLASSDFRWEHTAERWAMLMK
ncbi:spore coat protein SA [Fontibacillus phaseoli]|uniref:Spore coat protein SA n=1 Tax=Fontibacillus phaseoli TaxID=1416533 RepID=A0A369BED7_9BACL|nr:glycosyltransferase family 4 protein [Fontibacillus phaseoli]RCX19761.1 spore coat protein SA [Fontibacillus phaseoli]